MVYNHILAALQDALDGQKKLLELSFRCIQSLHQYNEVFIDF